VLHYQRKSPLTDANNRSSIFDNPWGLMKSCVVARKCQVSRRKVSMVVAAAMAVVTFGVANPVWAGTCPVGSACLGRASYTVETSGPWMMASSYIATSPNYENLTGRSCDDGTNVNNKSWRIRNWLPSSRKICVFDNNDLQSSLYVELYSTSIAWNSSLPDDLASSWYTQPLTGNC
jgi:hypothetical protein